MIEFKKKNFHTPRVAIFINPWTQGTIDEQGNEKVSENRTECPEAGRLDCHSVGSRFSSFIFFGLRLQKGNQGLVGVVPDLRF